ncbi:MAG: CarD family transcriptional regulator [Pseudomonadota bacterium]
MSSAKKTEKSRKAKATIARAALKSRTATKAKKPADSKARQAHATAAKTTARPAPKTKIAAKTAAKAAAKPATRSKSAAAKLRTAHVRLKKQAAAAKAARPAAKTPATKSTAAKVAAPKRTKTTQSSAAAKLKRSTTVSRGKSRAGRIAPVETKLTKVAVAVQQPAAPQTELQTVKKVDPERRAQVAAVLALRSLQKPAPAAEAAARTDEASKASVTQKAPKKAAEAAPAPVRAAVPEAKPPVPEAKPAAPVVEKPKPAKPAAPVKHGFKPLEFVVYPAHGVGQILAIEEQEVAGFKLELFVISFSKDKMILKVPTPKSIAVGMRKLASAEVVKQALNTLTGRARIKRTMWSRRAQEYEAKINSGDLVAIAEVVRDLYRSEAQPEQSYSERQLYEAALDRVAREIAAVQKLTETESLKLIDTQLQKSPRRGKAEDSETDLEAGGDDGDDGGIDEAA